MAKVFKSIPALMRITVVDPTKTVTFPGEELLARHLAAACAADPETLEDLLLATEPLRPGITRQVVNGLLQFDQKRHQNWMVKLDPFSDIFEVVDAHLEQLSLQGLPAGLILIDLAEKNIWTAAPFLTGAGEIKREDSLPVFENEQLSKKNITYTLDKTWRIIDLGTPPELLAAAYRSRPRARNFSQSASSVGMKQTV